MDPKFGYVKRVSGAHKGQNTMHIYHILKGFWGPNMVFNKALEVRKHHFRP